jgi:hypothetical protein
MAVLAVLTFAAGLHLPNGPQTRYCSDIIARPAMSNTGPPSPRSWWDLLLTGQKGASSPQSEKPPVTTPLGLSALFAQLDRNGDGCLTLTELRHALLVIGKKGDVENYFPTLDGCDRVSFEEFDKMVPELREAFGARMTPEGVLPSLYAPPEEWVETRTTEELNWERKVQRQAQQSGNQLRQNDILRKELGKG